MSWELFSILYVLTVAIVNIIDKYIVTSMVKKPLVLVTIQVVIGMVAVAAIYLLRGFSQISNLNIALSFLAGALLALAIFIYFKATIIEEISRVIPLIYLSPLFTLVLAALLIRETIDPIKYSGVFLLVGGAMLVSYRRGQSIVPRKAFWLMALFAAILSLNVVITKHILNFTDFWTVFSYSRIGAFLFLIPVLLLKFNELTTVLKRQGSKALCIISLNEALYVLAVFFMTLAVSLGPVTLVNAMASLQPFFVLLLATFVSIHYPSILKEELGSGILATKAIAIAMILTGAMIIT